MNFSTSYGTPKKVNIKKLLQMIEEEQSTNYVLYQDKIALLYSKLSRPGLAIEKYADILDIWTDNPEIFHKIAYEYSRLKDFDQSFSFEEKAQEFDPLNQEYKEMLEVYHMHLIKQHRFKNRRLKRKLHKYAIMCMKSAERFIRKRMLPEALEVLHYGLAATARYRDLYGQTLFLNNIAYVYGLQDDYDNALSSYKVALDISKSLRDKVLDDIIHQNIKDLESFKKGMFLQVKDQPSFMNFSNLMMKHWNRINQPGFDQEIQKLSPEIQQKLIDYKKLLNEMISETIPKKRKNKI